MHTTFIIQLQGAPGTLGREPQCPSAEKDKEGSFWLQAKVGLLFPALNWDVSLSRFPEHFIFQMFILIKRLNKP